MRNLKEIEEHCEFMGRNPEEDGYYKYERKRQAFAKTSGYKKIENYINGLKKKPEFLKTIKSARKKFGIPDAGFSYPVNKKKDEKISENYRFNVEFIKYVDDIAITFGLDAFDIFVESYVLFNNTKWVLEANSVDVIKIIDLYSLFYNTKEKDNSKLTDNKKERIVRFVAEARTYPVGILIHPYMSQRDVIDAVKKIFKFEVEPLQKKYRKSGIKLGVIRKKSEMVEERNNFIYENRKLGIKKLPSAVYEKYGKHFDYAYIYKILRDERKRKQMSTDNF
jgi:hypothetical protein